MTIVSLLACVAPPGEFTDPLERGIETGTPPEPDNFCPHVPRRRTYYIDAECTVDMLWDPEPPVGEPFSLGGVALGTYTTDFEPVQAPYWLENGVNCLPTPIAPGREIPWGVPFDQVRRFDGPPCCEDQNPPSMPGCE